MIIIILSTIITILMGFSVYIERPIDLKIIRGKHNYSNLFIKRKHWFYNAPRIIIWTLCCMMFIYTRDLIYIVELSILDAVANFFLFRFWHDSLYQMIVSKELKKGRGFRADSQTPKHLEDSFWDTILPDTWENRKYCLYVAITLKTMVLLYLILIKH